MVWSWLRWQNDEHVEEVGENECESETKCADQNVAENNVPECEHVGDSFAVERLIGLVQVDVAFNRENPNVSFVKKNNKWIKSSNKKITNKIFSY